MKSVLVLDTPKCCGACIFFKMYVKAGHWICDLTGEISEPQNMAKDPSRHCPLVAIDKETEERLKR